MESTHKKPGRPLEHGERLERIQVLVTPTQHQAAQKAAQDRGCSISEVYRDWIDKGRASDRKSRK